MTAPTTSIMKRPDLQKLWDSLLLQHTLFGGHSPAREKHDLRLARVGFIISAFLLTLAGVTELLFIIFLLWRLFA